MLLGHVYIGAILKVIVSRCLIFLYLSLFIHYFRIPDPIPHPYTDAFHMSSTRNAFSYYLYVLSTYPSSNYMYYLSIPLRILRFLECLTP